MVANLHVVELVMQIGKFVNNRRFKCYKQMHNGFIKTDFLISVVQGVAAVAAAVNSYNTQCPSTKLVLVGYSQVCLQDLILT